MCVQRPCGVKKITSFWKYLLCHSTFFANSIQNIICFEVIWRKLLFASNQKTIHTCLKISEFTIHLSKILPLRAPLYLVCLLQMDVITFPNWLYSKNAKQKWIQSFRSVRFHFQCINISQNPPGQYVGLSWVPSSTNFVLSYTVELDIESACACATLLHTLHLPQQFYIYLSLSLLFYFLPTLPHDVVEMWA